MPDKGDPKTHRFRDSHDREWRVYEHQRAALGGSTTVLVFECDAVVRCVRGYPEQWREMLPEDLERLSWDK